MLGPNGAGKSTVLRCIAGLLPIDDGRDPIDGRSSTTRLPRIFVPPERRPIGVVFQDYLLFANMSALENVAFGLRAAGRRKRGPATAADWLSGSASASHAGHRPSAPLRRQAQRVALARALATDPRVLLLDEPLAALDVGARGDVRRDLRRHLESFDGMRLLVTHDPVDAYALADRVVVLEAGQIMQHGHAGRRDRPPPVAVRRRARRPQSRRRRASSVTRSRRTRVVPCVTATTIGDGPAYVAVRPQAVSLHRHRPEGSARNVWPVVVATSIVQHDRVRVRLDGESRSSPRSPRRRWSTSASAPASRSGRRSRPPRWRRTSARHRCAVAFCVST